MQLHSQPHHAQHDAATPEQAQGTATKIQARRKPEKIKGGAEDGSWTWGCVCGCQVCCTVCWFGCEHRKDTHLENLIAQIPFLCPSQCWPAFGTLPFHCEHSDAPQWNSHQEMRLQRGGRGRQCKQDRLCIPATSERWEPSCLCSTSQAKSQGAIRWRVPLWSPDLPQLMNDSLLPLHHALNEVGNQKEQFPQTRTTWTLLASFSCSSCLFLVSTDDGFSSTGEPCKYSRI